MRLLLSLTLVLAAAVTAAPAKPPAKLAMKPPAKKPGAANGKKPAPAKGKPAKPVKHPRKGGASQLPGGSSGPATVFQTNSEYDPRIDLKTDFVAVHKHGASWEEIDRAIQSWRGAGYPVHRMFFIGSDAGGAYTSGKADGMSHPGDIEVDAAGNVIAVGDRPYMVPTAGWLEHLKEHIRRAIDSGAEGIWPEEPLMHAAAGYSPAFKAAWQDAYQAPWEPPQSSPANFFKASRVKSDLYLHAVDELLRYTKEYARQKGRDVKFFLPVHSPVSYASWKLIFPHAAASRLPIDGLVAQVWSGPAGYPVTYEGKTGAQYFESSWMLYSYFANLMDGVNRPLYLLADPVEDDPGSTWVQYEQRYKSVLSASLLFPQARGYEVMPWPDRIYLPGSTTGGGTPGPAPYLTLLSNIGAALKELPAGMDWSGGARGIGVLTLDTMMWQRGGPQESSMRSLHGLVLPLLKRGIPAEIVPAERAADRAYLSRFKVLLLSYDMQKPLGPEVNQGLADWVKAGGALVVLGGEDAYNDIGEWWNRSGYPGPTEHLLRTCSAGVEVPLRTVRSAGDRFKEALKAEGQFRAQENRHVYSLPLSSFGGGGKPVYVRFSDLYAEDGWGTWLGRVRVLEGGRVRADFTAGSVGERPFLVEDSGSQAGDGFRFADGDASFVYRFNRLGPDARLELELANQFRVSVAADADPGAALQPAVEGLPSLRVPSTYPVVSYPLAGAEPLYRTRGEEAQPGAAPGETVPAWASVSGQGWVVYCGVPAAFGTDGVAGADLIRGLVKVACDKVRLPYAEGPIVARRGPYVVAHSLGRTMRLKGKYLDLFDPDLPLLEDPQLPYREPALYKEVRLSARVPVLLHGSHRARVLEATPWRTRLLLDGPKDTWGILRVFVAGMSLVGAEATDARGQRVEVQAQVEGPTLKVRYPQQPTGLTLTLRWIRPEARLTK
jgi:hypothetical protein